MQAMSGKDVSTIKRKQLWRGEGGDFALRNGLLIYECASEQYGHRAHLKADIV